MEQPHRVFAVSKPYVAPKKKKALLKAICMRRFGMTPLDMAKAAKRRMGAWCRPAGMDGDAGLAWCVGRTILLTDDRAPFRIIHNFADRLEAAEVGGDAGAQQEEEDVVMVESEEAAKVEVERIIELEEVERLEAELAAAEAIIPKLKERQQLFKDQKKALVALLKQALKDKKAAASAPPPATPSASIVVPETPAPASSVSAFGSAGSASMGMGIPKNSFDMPFSSAIPKKQASYYAAQQQLEQQQQQLGALGGLQQQNNPYGLPPTPMVGAASALMYPSSSPHQPPSSSSSSLLFPGSSPQASPAASVAGSSSAYGYGAAPFDQPGSSAGPAGSPAFGGISRGGFQPSGLTPQQQQQLGGFTGRIQSAPPGMQQQQQQQPYGSLHQPQPQAASLQRGGAALPFGGREAASRGSLTESGSRVSDSRGEWGRDSRDSYGGVARDRELLTSSSRDGNSRDAWDSREREPGSSATSASLGGRDGLLPPPPFGSIGGAVLGSGRRDEPRGYQQSLLGSASSAGIGPASAGRESSFDGRAGLPLSQQQQPPLYGRDSFDDGRRESSSLGNSDVSRRESLGGLDRRDSFMTPAEPLGGRRDSFRGAATSSSFGPGDRDYEMRDLPSSSSVGGGFGPDGGGRDSLRESSRDSSNLQPLGGGYRDSGRDGRGQQSLPPLDRGAGGLMPPPAPVPMRGGGGAATVGGGLAVGGRREGSLSGAPHSLDHSFEHSYGGATVGGGRRDSLGPAGSDGLMRGDRSEWGGRDVSGRDGRDMPPPSSSLSRMSSSVSSGIGAGAGGGMPGPRPSLGGAGGGREPSYPPQSSSGGSGPMMRGQQLPQPQSHLDGGRDGYQGRGGGPPLMPGPGSDRGDRLGPDGRGGPPPGGRGGLLRDQQQQQLQQQQQQPYGRGGGGGPPTGPSALLGPSRDREGPGSAYPGPGGPGQGQQQQQMGRGGRQGGGGGGPPPHGHAQQQQQQQQQRGGNFPPRGRGGR